MMRFLFPAIFAFFPLTGAWADAVSDEYRGTIECSGPYMQEIPGLPAGSIQLRLSWDKLFANYDVALKIGPKAMAGVTRLFWQYPIPREARVPYLSGSLRFGDGKSLELFVHLREDRIPEGGPINSASLEFDERSYYYLQCRTNEHG